MFKTRKVIVEFLGFLLSPGLAFALPDAVWVSRADGSVQCQPKSGKTLESSKEALERMGVKVLDARSESDGMMHMQVCGSPTGKIHRVQILRKDLSKAKKAGFKVTASGSQGGSVGGTASRSG